jgi:hypothetical protein
MIDFTKWVCLGVIAFGVSSCGAAGGNNDNTYKIEPEGGVETTDRNVYASLGDVTFTLNQKYKITLMGEGKQFHYLIVNAKKKVGNKNVFDEKGVSLPIVDGSRTFDCNHSYDVKIGKEDDVNAPVCEFELVGTIYPSGGAKLQQTK